MPPVVPAVSPSPAPIRHSRPSGSRIARLAAVALLLATGALAGSVPAGAKTAGLAASPTSGTFWVSSPTDASRRLLPVAVDEGPGTAEIVVDPAQRRQAWWGTGAALTDASRQLLAEHPGAVKLLFAPARATGARLNMLRLPLSATDFSPTLWRWRWDGLTVRPPARAQAANRMIRDSIMRLRPDLRVVAAPWSAPAAMKTTGSLRGGGLLAGAEGEYAAMLAAQATFLRQHRIPLWALTPGNEPGYSTDYPTMTMTDAQLTRVAQVLGPRLDDLRVRLWAVDHNWSDRARYDTVLRDAPGAHDGAAFHCYGGRPSQMADLAVPRMVTECTGTTDGWTGTFAWDARNLVADAVAAGSSGLMFWNLALDAEHGPLDTGSRWGCKTCRGLLTVTPHRLVREPEFYTLAHLSRAADPGARVVSSTASAGLSVAAFRNRDGTIGVFGHNNTGGERLVRISVEGGDTVGYPVQPGEMFTYRSS
jgi:glucosylceramidase